MAFLYVLPQRKHLQRKSWTACNVCQRRLVRSKSRWPACNSIQLYMQAGEELVLCPCVIYNWSSGSTFCSDSSRFLGPSCTIQRVIQKTVSTSLHSLLLHYSDYQRLGVNRWWKMYIRPHLKGISITMHEKQLLEHFEGPPQERLKQTNR